MNGTTSTLAIAGLILAALTTVGCAPIHVTTSIEVDRPVETTWDVFADADRLGEWMHASWDRPKMHWADTDPEGIGVPRLVRLGDDGEEMELTQTITSVEPGKEFQYTFEHEWADTDFLFLFEPKGPDACTIRWEFTAEPKGWHGIWMNMARGSMRDRFDSHLAELKALVEAEPDEP